jgi:peptidoglycan/xylan/chitin deacetylase (PgdA/CDA1 family)
MTTRPLILVYHRVATPTVDPWNMAVSPAHFDEHLQVLNEFAVPMPLSQVIVESTRGSMPKRSVIVTFDDGYADNLLAAAPSLIRRGIPATVFVCSGYVGDGRMFWWDDLVRILLVPEQLPDELDLGGESFRSAPRLEFLRVIHKVLQPMRPLERAVQLEAVARWAGATAMERSEDERALDAGELAQLAASRDLEIGCHTVTHPLLTALSYSEQQMEIADAKRDLERLTGRAVTTFAYPFGVHDETTRALVRDAGFAAACSVEAGAVEPDADRFQLPRLTVNDCDGEAFERMLMTYFNR